MGVNLRCGRCGLWKSPDHFNKSARRKTGRHLWCRPCMTSYQREKKYGLTAEKINEMLARGCEVCGSRVALCIDHDHESGQVRGVLCDWHNRALGLLHDSADEVRALLLYRERFEPTKLVMPNVPA